jgi:hypothetical protein
MADISIPEIPTNPTDSQISWLQLHFARISLLQAEEARKLAVQHEANAAARHAALLAQHKANNGPLTFGDLAAAAAARVDLEVTVEQIDRVTRKRWEWLQGLDEAAPTPDAELDPVFYLAELGDEFDRYKWPRTLQGAIDHWKQYGKPQGRRGRSGGPGWGPKAEDAPPGTVL